MWSLADMHEAIHLTLEVPQKVQGWRRQYVRRIYPCIISKLADEESWCY